MNTKIPDAHSQMQQRLARNVLTDAKYHQSSSGELIESIILHKSTYKEQVMGASACSNGKKEIIISGGTQDFFGKSASKQVWKYDTETHELSALPDLPTTIYAHRMVYVQASDTIFVLGGNKDNEMVDDGFFVLENGKWEQQLLSGGDFGQYPSVCICTDDMNNSLIHIVDGGGHYTIDPDTNDINFLMETPFKVFGAEMIYFDNKLYVFGGYWPREYKNDIYMFDMNKVEWQKLNVKLPTVRSFYGCVQYYQYAIIVGGYINNDILVFDLENKIFIQQSLVLPKYISRMSISLINNDIHVFGAMFGGDTNGINDHYIIQLKDLVLEAKILTVAYWKQMCPHQVNKDLLQIIADYYCC